MAQTGYTPIKIYASSTAAAVPSASNLSNVGGAELAINITDGKLFYKDNTGTVQVIAGGGITIPQVIDVNSSSAALRVTQTGTGNALVVEDSANPDSTPFVVDANGRVVIQKATVQTTTNTGTPIFQSHVTGGNQAGLYGWSSNSASPAQLRLLRSASGTIGTLGAVSDGFDLGSVQFYGDDGSDFVLGAQILAEVDGTPGANDMPGRLVFSTTADGASSPTERMRINNAGQIGFNSANLGGASGQYRFAGNITGAVSVPGILYTPTVQSDVTTAASVFQSQPSTQDAAFTLADLRHFGAFQGTITGGSRTAPTNQIGFLASSTLTGATNNYGFRSDIAAGTGRWNLYMAGTANNYMAGNLSIGTGAAPNTALDVKGTLRLNGSSSGYVGLAPAAAAGSTTYTLPATDGASGQVLSTDGSGTLSWSSSSGISTGKSIAMAMIFGF